MNVGVVGESKHETRALIALLKNCLTHINFVRLIKNQPEGSQWKNKKTLKNLRLSVNTTASNKVGIFSHDLDGPESNDSLKREKKKIFEGVKKSLSNLGQLLYLLNIQELEALILADIETFNKEYRTTLKFSKPEAKKDPKEFLEQKTEKAKKQYQESHCPELFAKLNPDTVQAKCAYFKAFIQDLKAAL